MSAAGLRREEGAVEADGAPSAPTTRCELPFFAPVELPGVALWAMPDMDGGQVEAFLRDRSLPYDFLGIDLGFERFKPCNNLAEIDGLAENHFLHRVIVTAQRR